MTYLTPTQKRLMEVLGDGGPHTVEELLPKLNDELSTTNNLQMHISFLRDRLQQEGKTVINERRDGAYCYRLARYIDSGE